MHQKNQENQVTVYSAEERGSSIFSILSDSYHNLDQSHALGLRLFKRNVKAKYRNSVLGVFWAIIPPLVTAGLWIFLRSANVTNFGDTGIPYPVFVMTGAMLWQIFSEAVNSPLAIVKSNQNLLVKINIPREGLLLTAIYELIYNLIIKIGILGIVLVYFGSPISWNILLFPIGLTLLILCGFSLGLLLVPIGMLWNDIQKIVTLGLPFLMYLTPVIYPPQISGPLGIISKYNPVSPLLIASRAWLTSHDVTNWTTLVFLGIFFIGLTIVGLAIFKASMPRIIERIGS